MSNVIELLTYLQTPKSLVQLQAVLNLSVLDLAKLIDESEQLERGLIRVDQAGNYFVTRKLDWFNKEQIIARLYQSNINYSVEIVPQLPSTNSYVLSNIANYANKSVVTTEFQSHGRGRNDKRWINRVATDIAVSIVYWFELAFNYQLLPLVAVIAVNRLFKQYQINTRIKWPNDVLLISKEKIAGILVESGVLDNKRYIVIGIGIDNIIGANRTELLINLTKHVDEIIKSYQLLGFTDLKQEWLTNCIHYNQSVNILRNQELIESGVNIGIDDSGALLIRNSAGKINKYSSIDVSLR
jgi:BirA family biotin operon repressor/biotin-[acetyl-CoA-carboxylase] ligase